MAETNNTLTNSIEPIIDALKEKACLKQQIYKTTLEVFNNLKLILGRMGSELHESMQNIDAGVEINQKETGIFETEIKFGSDILFFSMHTNIFNFPDNHSIHNLDYVKEDPLRSYCGMIQIYNFLGDSIKYNRYDDVGYLLARIFINKEKHFFVEGHRQFGFLYNDFGNAVINEVYLRAITESAILFAIQFDLFAPPYKEVQQITVEQKKQQEGFAALKTGKRVGYKFEAELKQGVNQ